MHLSFIEIMVNYHKTVLANSTSPEETGSTINKMNICGQAALQIGSTDWQFTTLINICESLIQLTLDTCNEKEAMKYLIAVQACHTSESIKNLIQTFDHKCLRRYNRLASVTKSFLLRFHRTSLKHKPMRFTQKRYGIMFCRKHRIGRV